MAQVSHHQPHERDQDLTDCEACGSTFNLAAQYYYDSLCPDCKRDQDGEDAVNPTVGSCYVCSEDVRKDDQEWSHSAAPYDVHGPVLVCPDHRDHTFSPSRGV